MTTTADDQMYATVREIRECGGDYPVLMEEERDLLESIRLDPEDVGIIVVGLPRQRQRGSWYYTAAHVTAYRPDYRQAYRQEWEGRTPPSAETLAEAVEQAQEALRVRTAARPAPVSLPEAIRDTVRHISVGRGALARWARLRLASAGVYSVSDEAIWAEVTRMEEAGELVLASSETTPARSSQQLYSLAAGLA